LSGDVVELEPGGDGKAVSVGSKYAIAELGERMRELPAMSC